MTQKFEKNHHYFVSSLFLYSENMQDVFVAVAETKCDVEYSNKTCIICMTNTHSPSGWAPVHVTIGSAGMARWVRLPLGVATTAGESWSMGGEMIGNELFTLLMSPENNGAIAI